jgi:hypothetical protein
MVFQAVLKNGPAAPELRRDAHDCIMVAILRDQPNTRLRGSAREPQAPLGIVIVVASLPDHHSLPGTSLLDSPRGHLARVPIEVRSEAT